MTYNNIHSVITSYGWCYNNNYKILICIDIYIYTIYIYYIKRPWFNGKTCAF